MLAPIGIAGEAAISDDQGRRVVGLGLGPQADDVLVEDLDRHIVLDRGIAVLDERDVHREERAALGHDLHPLALRRRHDHLPLVAPRLVVILDAVGALRLQPPDVGERVLEGVDLGIDVGGLGAVDDLAGREGARAEDLAGALHLGGGEDLGRPGRRVVDGGRAHGEVGDLTTSSAAG